MCGITGCIDYKDQVTHDRILKMNSLINHRGPDGYGVFTGGGDGYSIGMGHVRLAIVDLTEKGHQPMGLDYADEKKGRTIYKDEQLKNCDIIITFNGEIYNFQELRVELEVLGHKVLSHCDTEILLRSYAEWGMETTLKKLNGMFAFVIWDKRLGKIFGARDRLGKKPLKYYYDDTKFVFASELKSIFTQGVPREVDINAVDDYLTLQFVPAPATGFKNVYKLPHASYFVYDILKKEFKSAKYWELSHSKKTQKSKVAIKADLEALLSDSIKRRMIADVEVGAFLSGGVDSSAIVALASKFKKQLKTFTIKFDEKKYDESGYAEQVAKQYKTDHRVFTVKPDDLLGLIDKLAYQYEEPYADVSALPTYILSQKTAEHVKVVLNGDGGDENFAGYDRYRSHKIANMLRFVPFKFVFAALCKYLAVKKNSLKWYSGFIMFKTLNNKDVERHYNYTFYFDTFSKDTLYKPEIKSTIVKDKYGNFGKYGGGRDVVDNIMNLDFNTYLPDDLMVKVDIATMAFGLESRSPILDYRFVEYAAGLPSSYKMKGKKRKIIFKEMLSKYLSDDILYRKKAGFDVPVSSWFRNELREHVSETILDGSGLCVKLFNEDSLKKLIAQHNNGMDHGKKLLALLNLNLWYKSYFTDK